MLQAVGKLFHRLLNPHCPECLEEEERKQVCNTCEVLRGQLDIANSEKLRLLDRLTIPPERPEVPQQAPLPITRTKHLPWQARRQILEKEDRERARLMREAAKPDAPAKPATESDVHDGVVSDAETEALEKELLSAQTSRESEAAS